MQDSIYPKPKINVGQNERKASMLGGGALVLYALARPSRASIPFILSGSYLLYQGITGKSFIYDLIGITRDFDPGSSGIRVERAVTINRPVQDVYSYWRNFENLPSFMKHLEAVHVDGDVSTAKQSHWVASAPFGAMVEWDAEIVEERENDVISWRSLPGSEIENSGTVRFKPAPGGRGTEVHVRLKYSPPIGSASAAIARLFGEEPAQQVRDDLSRFKQVIEAGETATTKGQPSARLDETEQERLEIQKHRQRDVVQEASEESFPASDPPSWTSG